MTSSWMLVAGALFATMGLCAKFLAGQFSGAELSFYRSLVGLVGLGGFVLVQRRTLATPHWQGHCWRGLSGTASLIAYFYAMTQLPLATAVALNYTSPLWLALLSWLWLGERFRGRQLAAVGLGFVGAILLLRPTFSGGQAGAGLIGLASGFCGACAYLNVKRLGAAGEPEWRVVFYFALAGTLGSAATHATVWREFHPVELRHLGLLLTMGLAATLAQLAMTRAYHTGSTLMVAAFSYSTILFASLAGLWFFDEVLPPIAWAGVALVIGSGLLAKAVGGAPTEKEEVAPLPVEED
ncbi:MAG: DMT family transporter [Verrucomicrobia bacterium]|nr:DMT family transporter [Verrucomicrobiota bacterium]